MFGELGSANAKDNVIIPGIHRFEPPISRRNPNNSKFNKPVLKRTGQNIGKEVSPGANKPPRASSAFPTPHKPVKKQSFYGGVNGSGSPGDGSNPNNPRFNTKSLDQYQNPNYFNQAQNKKKNKNLDR